MFGIGCLLIILITLVDKISKFKYELISSLKLIGNPASLKVKILSILSKISLI